MSGSLVADVRAHARRFDAGSLSAPDAVRMLEALSEACRLVDGMLAQTAKRIADLDAHRLRAERNAASLVANTMGVGVAEARLVIDTATKMESFPEVESAVRGGQLSSRQAQLIVDAGIVNRDAVPMLIAAADDGLVALRDACVTARAQVEDEAERSARQLALRTWRTWTDADGMLAGHFRLPPEVGGQVKQRIAADVQRIFRELPKGSAREPLDRYAADAFVELVLADRISPKNGSAPAKRPGDKRRATRFNVHVLISHGALVRGGAVEGEVCEIPGVGPVNAMWVRELLGEAFLTAVITKGKDISTVAHLGRHVPAEVQTALLVSGHECSVKGCGMRGYLERDHRYEYSKGGPTAFWNLLWLCYVHHRMKSQGWILGTPDPVTGKCELRAPPERAA